jgi:hypothetical protein
MEPRKPAESLASRTEGRTSAPRPEERHRRFRIVKLEERIAPKHNSGGSAIFGGGL